MGFDCGLQLVRDLSSGRCNRSNFGCDNIMYRSFWVRDGCVGDFWCRKQSTSPIDSSLRCGDGARGETHHCDCRWTLPLVVPLHPYKFDYGCNLYHSIVRNDYAPNRTKYGFPATTKYSWSDATNRLRFVPVFSSQEDLDAFAWLVGRAAVSNAIIVPTGNATNIPAKKKLRGVWHVFHGPQPASHAIAIDADVAVNHLEGQRAWEYVQAWSRQRIVIADVGRGQAHTMRMHSACDLANLPRLPGSGYTWFADAPIFERDDFDDFYARVTARSERAFNIYTFFEHMSYMCYKAQVQKWTVLGTKYHLEDFTQRLQDYDISQNYSFTWARGPSNRRLFRFHLDLDKEFPALSCLRAMPSAPGSEDESVPQPLALRPPLQLQALAAPASPPPHGLPTLR
jgi:hypothetical protein